ncbi:MAG: hypothetical protein ACQEQA_04870 [Bacillota bacterium]
MTIILATTLLTVILSLFFYRSINRYRYFIYAFFALAALLISEAEATIVSLGYVALGIFLVVMYTGVLNRGLVWKRLMGVRAELSIIASILLIPHALVFGEYLLEDVGVFSGTISYYLGILAFIIMVPLTLTSFMFVRKQVGGKRWKVLHKFAYLFYAMVALHLILIQNDRMWMYIAIFGVYFIMKGSMKLETHFKKRKTAQA